MDLVVVKYVMKAGHPHNIYHSIHHLPVCTIVDVMQMTSLHYVLVSYTVATALQGPQSTCTCCVTSWAPGLPELNLLVCACWQSKSLLALYSEPSPDAGRVQPLRDC